MPPRIGYLLPTRERVMESRHETASLLALAERAEVLGFDSVWVGDSITARPRHEPLTLLSAVAARTKRVELGTAVLLPALRNPVVLAHGIATLDQISQGRFILGLGAGWLLPAGFDRRDDPAGSVRPVRPLRDFRLPAAGQSRRADLQALSRQS